MATSLVRIQHRRNTAAQWTLTNETLLAGELGYETDTGRSKLGDGTTGWTALAYQPDPASIAKTYATRTDTAGVALHTHFQGDDQRLFMTISADDGAHWRYVPDIGWPGTSVFTCPQGAIRDPSISPRRNADGYWYLVHTVLPTVASHLQTPTGTDFCLDRSRDLLNWSHVKTITLRSDSTKVWAPEWFIDSDGSWHVIATHNTNGMHEVHPFNSADLTGGWSGEVFLSIGTAGYDGTITKQGADYILTYVNSGICFGRATTLTGPYTKFAGPLTGTNGLEGPTLLQLPDGRWRMFLDTANEIATNLVDYKYMDSSSSDLLTCTWGGLVSAVADGRMRHGTVIRLPDRETALMLNALPAVQQRRGYPSLKTTTAVTSKPFTVPHPYTDATLFATVDLPAVTTTTVDSIRLGATGDCLGIQARAAGTWAVFFDSPTGVNGTGASGQTRDLGAQTTGRHVIALRLKGLTLTGYVDGAVIGSITVTRGNGAVWGNLFGQYAPHVYSGEVFFRGLTDQEIADQTVRLLGS